MSIARPIVKGIVRPILSTVDGGKILVGPTIENGGFEIAGSGTDFEGWVSTEIGSSTVDRDTSEKYSGSASLRLTVVSGGNVYVNKTGLITAGKNYRYSFWGKCSDTTKTLGVQNTTIYEHTLTTSWQRFTGSFVGQTSNFLLIRRTFSLTYNIWVDNFELIEEQ